MKRIVFETQLSEDLSNYMEKLFYEKNSYKELNEIIIKSKGELGNDREAAKFYAEQFVQANLTFNLAIKEIVDLYIEDPSLNKDFISVEISFSTKKITFFSEEKEEKGECLCSL